MKKKKETMPEMGKAMETTPTKRGMDMGPDGEMVQVKKHSRHKAGGTQKHPAKQSQPLSMRFIERD